MTAQIDAEPVPEHQDLLAARRVLKLEADGLTALGAALDSRFVEALDLLAAARGRIIVSGMGKSGHVAHKVAATLASTGTPAQYVHPGEASHGDLGMIARDDAVIALSNSGETAELGDIIGYSRRYGIPLIAITARAASQLAERADVAIILPGADEACPMGLSPTTSTTMMLALGDAIAIALLERKGFSPQDYHLLHPGGSLGQKLKRVNDVMHGPEELPLCRPDTPMSEAILVMTAKTWGCVGVVGERGWLEGIITDGDLRRHIEGDLFERRASEVMTENPQTIPSQALVAEALGLMNACKIHCLFVVEEDVTGAPRPIGIVRIHDCLRVGVT